MDSRIYSDKMFKKMKSHLNNEENKYITCPKFVFLCGKAFSDDSEYYRTNRGYIDKLLSKKSKDVFVVLSEKLWEDSFDSSIDLLTFEEFLAEISDTIILFVESPGSFCELGAFAYADKLFGDKLIIVIDEKYENDRSFIITGPAAKAERNGAKIIYAPLDGTGLLSSKDLRDIIDEKIKEFSSKNSKINKRTPNHIEGQISLNSFIIELIEIIKIMQPISRKELIEIYKKIKNFSAFKFVKKDGSNFNKEIKCDYIIKLLETVKIIKLNNDFIFIDNFEKVPSFMFKYSEKSENKERNRLLCRKYRYRHEGLLK